MSYLLSHLLNGLLLSALLIVALRPVARDLQLVDHPSGRKRHLGDIPLCGGLAIFVAFVVGGLNFDEAYRLPLHWSIGLSILMLIGLADDRWHLQPLPRLTIQAIAAAILIGDGGSLLLAAGPDVSMHLSAPILVAGLSILFTVGLANAVNMLDGADGLAGTTVAAALFWLAAIAAWIGDGVVEMQSLMLIAAILGFLAFNLRHPWRDAASVFLGDAGSMILGGALATFILHLATERGEAPAVSGVVLLWLVIVPVCDTLSLAVRRTAVSRSPFSSDRWHLHHLLLDRGVPAAAVAPLIGAISFLCGAVAFCGVVFRIPDGYLFLALVVPVIAHSVFVISAQSSTSPVRAGVEGGGEAIRYQGDPLGTPSNEVIG